MYKITITIYVSVKCNVDVFVIVKYGFSIFILLLFYLPLFFVSCFWKNSVIALSFVIKTEIVSCFQFVLFVFFCCVSEALFQFVLQHQISFIKWYKLNNSPTFNIIIFREMVVCNIHNILLAKYIYRYTIHSINIQI